jgi:hypothetical protein
MEQVTLYSNVIYRSFISELFELNLQYGARKYLLQIPYLVPTQFPESIFSDQKFSLCTLIEPEWQRRQRFLSSLELAPVIFHLEILASKKEPELYLILFRFYSPA